MPRFLGVLLLDTRFPRLPGDIGNPASFNMPTLTRVVRGARPDQAVQAAADQQATQLYPAFREAMRDLVREGAAAITTSCGFLVLMQERLQAEAAVPVVTSSLTLLPALLERHPRVGVLTISARHLGDDFLAAAGVPASRMRDVVIEGVEPRGAFAQAILGNEPRFDFTKARQDVLDAARRLHERDPALTEVVLECTNMPPYAREIEAGTGMHCWSLLQCERLFAPLRQARA